jgi:hypothetical protein
MSNDDAPTPEFDPTRPPEGAWFEQTEDGLRAGVSYKSRSAAIFVSLFAMVWGGGSLGGIYGSQISSGEFDFFASIFGLPFLAVTLFMIGVVCMAIAGKTEVTLTAEECVIYTGAFGLGRRKRFDPINVVEVTEDKIPGSRKNLKPEDPDPEPTRKIWIKTSGESFSILPCSKEQSVFLLLVLRQYLVPRKRGECSTPRL